MSVVKFPMPSYLRQMELKVEAGVDPDAIKGIEKLWLFRALRDRDEFDEHERQFYEWLRDEKITGMWA